MRLRTCYDHVRMISSHLVGSKDDTKFIKIKNEINEFL